METVTVLESVCIDGEWFAAHWAVQAVDGGTGEVLITAATPGQALVLRMDMGLAADLRRMAGFGAKADEARGEAAYWRECAEYAAEILARGRTAGADWARAALNAEAYLRDTLATEAPAPDGSRVLELESEINRQAQIAYTAHCELAGRLERLEARLAEPLATIERRQEEDAATFGEHVRRILALETAMRGEHRTMHATFNEHQARLDALAAGLKELEREMATGIIYALTKRVEELETWHQSCDEFDALMTQLSPPGHRHDGGTWIACPFCADDPLGMCSACNGTRRIWEMPPE